MGTASSGGWQPRWRHVHGRSLAGASFWCGFVETVLNAAVFARHFATYLVDQTDDLLLPGQTDGMQLVEQRVPGNKHDLSMRTWEFAAADIGRLSKQL